MIPCMGGWCMSRGKCAHYHAAAKKQIPVERLCGPTEQPVLMKQPKEAQREPAC